MVIAVGWILYTELVKVTNSRESDGFLFCIATANDYVRSLILPAAGYVLIHTQSTLHDIFYPFQWWVGPLNLILLI